MINHNDARFTVARLKNMPVFCIDRVYKIYLSVLETPWYKFEFDNGYGAGVMEYRKDKFGEIVFELAVLSSDVVCYSTSITNDIVRGSESEIDSLLDRISALL